VTAPGVTIVVPTLGRASLGALVSALAAGPRPEFPVELLVVDDRAERHSPLALPDLDVPARAGRRSLPAPSDLDGSARAGRRSGPVPADLDGSARAGRRSGPVPSDLDGSARAGRCSWPVPSDRDGSARAGRRSLSAPPDFGVRVLAGRAAGPAAARNVGWRAARHDWVVFLDDDVLPDPDWLIRLGADLTGTDAGGMQGNVRVPVPAGRRPTDWERVTAALADGAWITADMAYRRAALAAVGGFDERLPRAFREDAELAHRVRRAGWELRRGTRAVTHPVRVESRWVSVRTQRGNADDALLRRLYGPAWRELLDIPTGRRPRHVAVAAAAAVALGCAAAGAFTRKRGWLVTAGAAALAWAAGTGEFATARILPGPRDRHEVATMLATSAVIPPVATAHWLHGWLRWRGARPLASTPAAPAVAGDPRNRAAHRAGAEAEVGTGGPVRRRVDRRPAQSHAGIDR
jgi:glycosyltransferase involved in cell wall biosynthesis